jgi:hypothetical protein
VRKLIFVCLLTGCGGSAGPTTEALCVACNTDNDCAGNPCYADKSGMHYCGAPCDSCPAGFACLNLPGSTGQVTPTCFPTNGLCSATPVNNGRDMSMPGGGGSDGGGGNHPDLAGGGPPPTCTTPKGGTVTGAGGTVDRLYFGYTGDTRDMSSGSGYSSGLNSVIRGIYTSMGKLGVEFAMDGGDHMEASNQSEATACMSDYMSAAALLGKPVFMTYGNHECSQSYNSGNSCGSNGWMTDPKSVPFMNALTQMTGATKPWYRYDIMTSSGKATFLVVADDAWGSSPGGEEETWLTAQLTDADANSKYTFVSKHHPLGNSDQSYFATIYSLVMSHKYTLFLTGHSHEYKHQYSDHRSVVMGLGGAPFDNPNQMWNGYLTAMQCPDDHIYVTVYDSSTGSMMDSWNVPPQ